MNQTERIEAAVNEALWLAEQGCAIVEVYPPAFDGTDSDGKRPVGDEWQKRATRSPHTIEERIRRQNGQYGLLPAAGSRLLGLDIDHREKLPIRLPDSYRVVRGEDRGHAWYRLPEGYDAASLPAKTSWGEVRVEGANLQLIGPYSVHASGDVYMPHGHDISVIPADILEQLFSPKQAKAEANGHGPVITVTGGYQLPDDHYEDSRYEAIRDYTASRYKRGVSPEEIWAGVLHVLAPRFAQPLSEPELRSRFDRAWRGTPERLGEPLPEPADSVVTEPPAWLRLPPEVWTPPPARLLAPLVCDSRSMLFGAGDVGKSALVALIVGAFAGVVDFPDTTLLRRLRVGIVDYEDNEDEWTDRLGRVGLPALAVPYIAPRQYIGQAMPELQRWVDGEGVELVVIDSALAAAGGDAMAPETPNGYYRALRELDRPTFSIAHVPKASATAEHPFGSVYWANGNRLIWRAERMDDMTGHVVKLTNTKHNRWPYAPASVLILTWQDEAPGRLTVRSALNLEPAAPLIDRLCTAVIQNGGPLTVQAMAAATGQPEDTIRKTLARNPDRLYRVGETLPTAKGRPADLYGLTEAREIAR